MVIVDESDLLIERYSKNIYVTLMYPPWTDEEDDGTRARAVIVDQSSVRASDGIRISYDYKRDGYVIEQNTGVLDENENPVWVESAFIQAWARNIEDQCL